MPATPPTTPNFGLPRAAGGDPADFPTTFDAAMDLIDDAVPTTDSRLTDNRTPLDASVTMAKLSSTVIAALSKTLWVPHIVNYGDADAPNSATSIVGRIPIELATGQTMALIGVKHICTTVGGTPTVFKVQTDHASHGTLVNVTGLTGLQPATTPSGGTAGTYTKTYLGSPVTLANDDQVVIVLTTAGNSLGVNIAPILAYMS